ncbi:unnamed protein product [Linum trigynum]|uniref:KHDC4/BBP-like KH-domain type I domain-containing protein n=1 Tax=Linum trigynum TaxID=586398 RepID=A0AAV2EJJ0_9ROSI
MGTKVEPTSSLELGNDKPSTSSSVPSTGAPKVSIFASKSGFVIPKNKLSGSLVPIFRGGKKVGSNDAAAAGQESDGDLQRKTKWGPDLAQDAAVKKGRVLAYQTRVDQIAQQLCQGNLDLGEYEDSEASIGRADLKPSKSLVETKGSLELEKREVIGEILKLNPSYKAPPDYKPLLKEAAVVIPVKDHPEHNFVDLICGPGNQTQKRLEKETGVKLQLYGIESGSTEKVEVSTAGANQTHTTYDELTVLVSADTFEKVDSAVSVIELLVSSVPGNQVAVDNTADNQTPTPASSDVAKQEAAQVAVGEALQGGEFRHQQEPWMPQAISLAPIYPSPMLNNPRDPNLPPLFNTSPLQSHLGGQPPSFPPSMFNSVPPQPLPTGHHPRSNPYPPRNFPTPASQPFPAMAPSQGQMMIPRPNFASPLTSPNISGTDLAFTGNNIQSRQQPPVHQFPGVRMSSHSSATQNDFQPPQLPRPNVSLAHFPGPPPAPPRGNAHPAVGPFPGTTTNFYPPMGRHPSVASTTPQQQHSVHGDFHFQMHHQLNTHPQANRPMMQPNLALHPGAHMFQRPPQMGGQMGLDRPDVAAFAGSSSFQPRLPQMMSRDLGPMRSANQMQLHQQAYRPVQMTMPREVMGPNHQLLGSRNLPFGSSRPVAGQQVYDPFSPSAASQQPGMGRRADNNDPEYEDLMASVGLK